MAFGLCLARQHDMALQAAAESLRALAKPPQPVCHWYLWFHGCVCVAGLTLGIVKHAVAHNVEAELRGRIDSSDLLRVAGAGVFRAFVNANRMASPPVAIDDSRI